MYDQYADDIFKYLYVHVRDRELAEDLTADAFMKAWQHIGTFDFSQPRPWLYKIARNVLTDHWRKKKAVPLGEEMEITSDEDIEADIDLQLLRERVQRAVHQLPPTMRAVVIMRFILNYSARQTADSLKISESNVRIIQYRALKKLKQMKDVTS